MAPRCWRGPEPQAQCTAASGRALRGRGQHGHAQLGRASAAHWAGHVAPGNRGGRQVAARSSRLPALHLPEARQEGDQGLGATAPGVRREPLPQAACGSLASGSYRCFSLVLKRQWLPKSKMAPLGVDETIDKLKMMEGRSSSIRKAVRVAFDRAMNHLSRVHGEPASDLSDID